MIPSVNITSRQLKAFAAVARLNSFTRAAQQLSITQGGLSGMVRELESQVGARLFDRTTRTVALTAAGSTLLPVATGMLDSLDRAVVAIGKAGGAAARSLSVATTPMMSSAILPVVIREFTRRHPAITVKVRDLDRSQILAHVDSGELDAGFGVFLGAASGIERTLLLKLPFLLAAPESETLPETVTWRSLSHYQLLALAADHP